VAKIICGVDVSSETLDARIGQDGPFHVFARTSEGIEALAAFCKTHDVEFVAMEATGGYEKLPFGLLWLAGVPCAIVNPRGVRRFAEAMGIFEKTDRIDAGVIAHFSQVKRVVPQTPASATQEHLEAMVTRLRQITDLRTIQTNQRRLLSDAGVVAGIDELVALINRQIRSLEVQIAQSIDADPLWKVLDAAFRSIKGVADRTVARLMAELPEIGTLSGKKAAKLAGLAPLARDSGKIKGPRPIRGGRAHLRSILFVVAEIVRRYEPDFNKFHQTLTAAGKPKKVIRVALARKLLVRLNAKARDARKELGLAV
jgi:transposase